jgi:hypothetical protein
LEGGVRIKAIEEVIQDSRALEEDIEGVGAIEWQDLCYPVKEASFLFFCKNLSNAPSSLKIHCHDLLPSKTLPLANLAPVTYLQHISCCFLAFLLLLNIP